MMIITSVYRLLDACPVLLASCSRRMGNLHVWCNHCVIIILALKYLMVSRGLRPRPKAFHVDSGQVPERIDPKIHFIRCKHQMNDGQEINTSSCALACVYLYLIDPSPLPGILWTTAAIAPFSVLYPSVSSLRKISAYKAWSWRFHSLLLCNISYMRSALSLMRKQPPTRRYPGAFLLRWSPGYCLCFRYLDGVFIRTALVCPTVNRFFCVFVFHLLLSWHPEIWQPGWQV